MLLYLTHVFYLTQAIQCSRDLEHAFFEILLRDEKVLGRDWSRGQDVASTSRPQSPQIKEKSLSGSSMTKNVSTMDMLNTTKPHCRYASFLSRQEFTLVDFVNNCVTKLNIDGSLDWTEVACKDQLQRTFFQNNSDVFMDLRPRDSYIIYSYDNGLYICSAPSVHEDNHFSSENLLQ